MTTPEQLREQGHQHQRRGTAGFEETKAVRQRILWQSPGLFNN